MIYYLLRYLDQNWDIPGTGLYKYISFRAGCVSILSLVFSIFFCKKMIIFFTKKGIKEQHRNLNFRSEYVKENIPTMGGLSIIFSMLLPILLFAKLNNIYVLLLIFCTIGFGLIGFIDDYKKVFKRDKDGLSAKHKLFGQAIISSIAGLVLFFHKDVVIREYATVHDIANSGGEELQIGMERDIKSTKTNIPFFKKNELDYSKLVPFFDENFTWLVYVIVIIFIVWAMSNATNLTDGLDGLAAGTSIIVGLALMVLAYLSGNLIFAKYLNIVYIPDLGEVSIFCTAFVGACIGFLWYNAYPAQIFMGDTGSLTLGGLIAVLAIIIRKELLLPLLCGVFVAENLSVILQVAYFKYTKKRYGYGKRIFLCAPIHHHFQKKGMHESKIVTRFFIVGIIFVILSLITLKIR